MYAVVVSRIEIVSDVSQDPGTLAAVSIAEKFNGELGFAGDRDWVEAEFTAGIVDTVTLEGNQSATPLNDPYLWVRSGQCGYDILAENDDFEGLIFWLF